MLLLGRPAFGLFTRETAVIEAGLRIIRVTFPCYWLYVFLEVHADALRGCGRSVLPMAVIMTCLCALRTGCWPSLRMSGERRRRWPPSIPAPGWQRQRV